MNETSKAELAEVKADLKKAVSYAAECAGETNTLAHQLAEVKALAQAVVRDKLDSDAHNIPMLEDLSESIDALAKWLEDE